MVITWFIHQANGRCVGYAKDYETGFAACIGLYRLSGERLSYFVTNEIDDRINREPLTNS